MEIRPLGNTPLPQIINCFNKAFADYIVPFQVEMEPMRRRWYSCRVDYDLSYGVFAGHQLIGFMMTGIGDWLGKKTAYNSGTGVIPEYRGQRMVQQLYDVAIPRFRRLGIEQCLLEVIVGNDRALKAYERVGFTRQRRLKCFKQAGKIGGQVDPDWQFRREEKPDWETLRELLEYAPSWEGTEASIERMGRDCELWTMRRKEELVGFIALKPGIGQAYQFGIADQADWKAAGRQLWHWASGIHAPLRINNIAESAQRSLAILEYSGMTPTVDQWEMSFIL